MDILKFCFSFFFLLHSSTVGEDTVAEDIDVQQLERLVEMLTPRECEDLLSALSHPEENIFEHLQRLSPENNLLGLQPRAKRETPSALDSEAQCQTALTDWLLRYGKETYYDRLSRALHHIGRTDIATEVGKNINQDKALSLKRYVEDYHKYVNSLNFVSDTKHQKRGHQRDRKRTVSDLTWRDLDLIVEQVRVPPYQKGPLDVAMPVLYGLLLGFGGTLLIGTALLLVIVHISHGRLQNCHSRATSSSSSKAM
ncbi:transmembrane and death domain protein 1-like [Simochromis diagramma]|uniref:transmembrane and death domain protein 1-like n=1 Tax=Simochromis diagramma TaxID=43689 RepID=UPI001A7E6FD9|nr:transmembrane and death domain protein 1-like [Simochromis diagramma]